MGIRGELYTNQIVVDNRAYYFNVKENRKGDVFLQIVESKKDEVDERHAIVIFASELQKFCKGFDSALSFIDKNEKEKKKAALEKKKSAEGTQKKTENIVEEEVTEEIVEEVSEKENFSFKKNRR